MYVDATTIPIAGTIKLNPKGDFTLGNGSQFVDCIVKSVPYGAQTVQDSIMEPTHPRPKDPNAPKLRGHGDILHHEQLRRMQQDRYRQRRFCRLSAGRGQLHGGRGFLVRFLQSTFLVLGSHRRPRTLFWHRGLGV